VRPRRCRNWACIRRAQLFLGQRIALQWAHRAISGPPFTSDDKHRHIIQSSTQTRSREYWPAHQSPHDPRHPLSVIAFASWAGKPRGHQTKRLRIRSMAGPPGLFDSLTADILKNHARFSEPLHRRNRDRHSLLDTHLRVSIPHRISAAPFGLRPACGRVIAAITSANDIASSAGPPAVSHFQRPSAAPRYSRSIQFHRLHGQNHRCQYRARPAHCARPRAKPAEIHEGRAHRGNHRDLARGLTDFGGAQTRTITRSSAARIKPNRSSCARQRALSARLPR